ELTVQPHWHGGVAGRAGRSSRPPRLATVHTLPAPAGARIGGRPDPTAGDGWFAAEALLGRSAAVLLDYSQGGIYHSAAYQDRVAALARDADPLASRVAARALAAGA